MMLKKGTQVKIISGKDRGKTGEILEIQKKLSRIKVKSINMIKKHLKPTKENKGGIVSKENFIHISNLELDKESQTELNSCMVCFIICSTGKTSFIRPIDWPAKAGAAFISPPKYKSFIPLRADISIKPSS